MNIACIKIVETSKNTFTLSLSVQWRQNFNGGPRHSISFQLSEITVEIKKNALGFPKAFLDL